MKTKIIFQLTEEGSKISDALEHTRYAGFIRHIDADFDIVPPVGSNVTFAVEGVLISAKVESIGMEVYERDNDYSRESVYGKSFLNVWLKDAEIIALAK